MVTIINTHAAQDNQKQLNETHKNNLLTFFTTHKPLFLLVLCLFIHKKTPTITTKTKFYYVFEFNCYLWMECVYYLLPPNGEGCLLIYQSL